MAGRQRRDGAECGNSHEFHGAMITKYGRDHNSSGGATTAAS